MCRHVDFLNFYRIRKENLFLNLRKLQIRQCRCVSDKLEVDCGVRSKSAVGLYRLISKCNSADESILKIDDMQIV